MARPASFRKAKHITEKKALLVDVRGVEIPKTKHEDRQRVSRYTYVMELAEAPAALPLCAARALGRWRAPDRHRTIVVRGAGWPDNRAIAGVDASRHLLAFFQSDEASARTG